MRKFLAFALVVVLVVGLRTVVSKIHEHNAAIARHEATLQRIRYRMEAQIRATQEAAATRYFTNYVLHLNEISDHQAYVRADALLTNDNCMQLRVVIDGTEQERLSSQAALRREHHRWLFDCQIVQAWQSYVSSHGIGGPADVYGLERNENGALVDDIYFGNQRPPTYKETHDFG